jgi:hypothetical protein
MNSIGTCLYCPKRVLQFALFQPVMTNRHNPFLRQRVRSLRVVGVIVLVYYIS